MRWVSVGVLLIAAAAPSASALLDLLPAISPSASALADHDIVQDPRTGRILLRFSNEIDNLGAGPLLIVASRERSNEPITSLPAFQRILRDDGTTRDVPAGEIVWHPAHHHFHWSGAARYVLRDAQTGDVVRVSDKVSFCLADVVQPGPQLPGSPRNPVFNSCEHDTRTTQVSMGVSVGWGDVYDKRLVGQAFDVTDLMNGPARDYVLESTTDPGALLVQQNGPETASVIVRIGEGIPVGTGTSRPGV